MILRIIKELRRRMDAEQEVSFLTKLSLQSPLNLIVPETVDEGVLHGDHHHVEHRYHLVLVS